MSVENSVGPIRVPQFLIPEIDFDEREFDEKGRHINVTAVYKSGCFSIGQFYFDVEFCNFEPKIHTVRSPDLKFGIPDDCTVNIFLKNRNIWRWSDEFYAVTLKESVNYYKKYDYDKKAQTVSFRAKKRDGDQEDHYFTMNVDIFQKRSRRSS